MAQAALCRARKKVAPCQGSSSQLRSGLGCSHSPLCSVSCLLPLPGAPLTLRCVLLHPVLPLPALRPLPAGQQLQ